MNSTVKSIMNLALQVSAIFATLNSLTQKMGTCIALIFLGLIGLAYSCFAINKFKNSADEKDRLKDAIITLVSSIILIACSGYRVFDISKTEKRVSDWAAYAESNYIYTSGLYQVSEEAEDGQSQLNVARESYKVEDYETAREYAFKALQNGRAEAALLLASLYYYGFGVPRDLHLATNYMIEGAKLGFSTIESMEESIGEVIKEESLTTRDSMELRKTLSDVKFLQGIYEEILSADNSNKYKSILNLNHDKLKELASSGLTTAVLFLYMECIEEDRASDDGSEEYPEDTRTYAEIIASSGMQPTDPYSRTQLYGVLYGPMDYQASSVSFFIEKGIFPELFKSISLQNDLESKEDYLFEQYRLYLAQYNYAKSIVKGEIWRNQLLSYQHPYYPEKDCELAYEKLMAVTEKIKEAMPSLDQTKYRTLQ